MGVVAVVAADQEALAAALAHREEVSCPLDQISAVFLVPYLPSLSVPVRQLFCDAVCDASFQIRKPLQDPSAYYFFTITAA